MSENSCSIFCRVDEQDKENTNNIINTVKAFAEQNDLDDTRHYYQDNHLVYELNFFDDIDDVFVLLMNELASFSIIPPIASYWYDSTNDTVFFMVIDDELMEFESYEEAEDAWQEFIKNPPKDNSDLPYTKGKTSLVRIQVNKKSLDSIYETLQSLVDCNRDAAEVQKQLHPVFYKGAEGANLYQPDNLEAQWNGGIERLAPYIRFVTKKSPHLLIGVDLFDVDLFQTYPTDEQVAHEAEENRASNKETGMSYLPTTSADVKESLQDNVLDEAAESLTYYLLLTKGVRNVAIKIRHSSLGDDVEIQTEGGDSELYYVYNEELSSDKSWLK